MHNKSGHVITAGCFLQVP